MKFNLAWAATHHQNLVLKLCLLVTSICAIFFCITSVRLALKAPLVIERECFSKVLQGIKGEASPAEIEAFTKVALSKRFDTEANDVKPFLSDDEWNYRLKELSDLKSKSIVQRIFVNSVKIEGNSILVDSDRFLTIEKVKTVTPFLLQVSISKDSRTQSNPYGLILERVSEIKTKEDKK
jgi:hypothetical protein